MGIRIRHGARCYYCREWVEAGRGFLQRVRGNWFAHCDSCFKIKEKPKPSQADFDAVLMPKGLNNGK